LDEIRRRGAELVIIGSGTAEHARMFREDYAVECPILVDPELRAYAAAELRRGLASSINLGVLRHGLRALRSGSMQGATQGDPWQQGGVFVISPGNRVEFAHVSQEAGDHPDPNVVVKAIPRRPSGGRKAGAAPAKSAAGRGRSPAKGK